MFEVVDNSPTYRRCNRQNGDDTERLDSRTEPLVAMLRPLNLTRALPLLDSRLENPP